MKMQIKEFAEFTGVSVRTLHYYDEIGLLKPAFTDRNTGYRFYDEASLLRMQEILFYRELDFSLKSIGEILSSPKYDKEKALAQQKKLLKLKKERLERLICAIDSAEKGTTVMKAFDNSDFENYKQEVKKKWGNTEAYKEYEQKSCNNTAAGAADMYAGMDNLMGEFALCMKSGVLPSDEEAQLLVKKLQDYITQNFYTCTDEILSGLGSMYVCDERFKANIDKHSEGTAQFISNAVAIRCKK